jgi:hypothetical protein
MRRVESASELDHLTLRPAGLEAGQHQRDGNGRIGEHRTIPSKRDAGPRLFRLVDVLTMPSLEYHELPESKSVVALTAQVLADQAFHEPTLKVPMRRRRT